MSDQDFDCLRVRVDRGVAFVAIDHPPMNLFDLQLMQEVNRLADLLEGDDAVRVAVVESADPEFYIAHADVTLIQAMPETAPPKPDAPGPFTQLVDRYRTMSTVTIAKIAGRCRGGGSEFVLAMDMRFGALGRCRLAQPEVSVGIIPGGGGTQRLPRLVGRGRALEVILGCADVDAEHAERIGYLNRALPPDELDPFVDALAYRIASFPAETIALAKQAVDAAERPLWDGLTEEADLFNRSVATPAARERMAAFLAAGGQTREVEMGLDAFPAGGGA